MEPRYLAARCAASAACGLAEDGPKLSDMERTRWRTQSREWLREELAFLTKELDRSPGTAADLSVKMLVLWQVDPDLAGVRQADALNNLSAEDRAHWTALWKQVGDVLTRAQSASH